MVAPLLNVQEATPQQSTAGVTEMDKIIGDVGSMVTMPVILPELETCGHRDSMECVSTLYTSKTD